MSLNINEHHDFFLSSYHDRQIDTGWKMLLNFILPMRVSCQNFTIVSVHRNEKDSKPFSHSDWHNAGMRQTQRNLAIYPIHSSVPHYVMKSNNKTELSNKSVCHAVIKHTTAPCYVQSNRNTAVTITTNTTTDITKTQQALAHSVRYAYTEKLVNHKWCPWRKAVYM